MSPSDHEILKRLSLHPSHILEGVISIPETHKTTTLKDNRQSSLGRLDALPLELLHQSLAYLDLRSLSRLSRVSIRGKSVVDSLLPRSQLAEAAGYIFEVLAKAKINDLHSVSTLWFPLFTERCTSCGAFGPFLFLLSAERCCYLCLVVNQSLWMITSRDAKETFVITNAQVKTLPFMGSTAGSYVVSLRHRHRTFAHPQFVRLTSVRAAKELALKVHGSLEALETRYPFNPGNLRIRETPELLPWYRHAPLRPLSQDPLTINDRGKRPLDPFSGMGAVAFPSLLNGQVEHGSWCLGCEEALEEYDSGKLPPSKLSRLVPQGCDEREYLLRMRYKAWSEADLILHAKYCHADTIAKYCS